MKDILIKIKLLYGINVASFERVTKGFLSDNYFITDEKTKYFLKKYRFDNADRIFEIHSVKHFFANGGIPVILPISSLNGTTFFEHDGGYYALFPFIDGKHFESGKLPRSAVESMASMLGKIHLLGKDAKLNVSESFKIENREITLRKIDNILSIINSKNNKDDFDKMALKNIELKRDLLLNSNQTIDQIGLKNDHLIHGDYLDQNLFFDDKDRVKYVFDLEKSNYSLRTFELFRSMFNSIFLFEDTGVDLEKASIYLRSYSAVYPISVDELRKGLQLYFLKIINGFWVES